MIIKHDRFIAASGIIAFQSANRIGRGVRFSVAALWQQSHISLQAMTTTTRMVGACVCAHTPTMRA